MRSFFILSLVPAAALMLPHSALAACDRSNRLCSLILTVGDIVDVLIGILAALAVLVFFWGIVRYIASAGNEKSKEQGRRIMIGGIIALFVLFAIFGIIRFIMNAFDIRESDNRGLPPPQVDFRSSGGGSGGGGGGGGPFVPPPTTGPL